MPALIRLYIQSVLIGFAISAGFAVVLIWLDIKGLGHLILTSPQGWIAALMLFVFNGIIFAGVQFALRVMMMAEKDEGPRGGLRQHSRAALKLAPVPAAAHKPAQPGRR
jgi:hypothetical protein